LSVPGAPVAVSGEPPPARPVEATPLHQAELPPPAMPDHLRLNVPDPLGDWTLEVHRHDHSLDLLFAGHASLSTVISDASSDLRQLLGAHGQTLGSLTFQERGSHGQDAPGQDAQARGSTPTSTPRARARPAAMPTITHSSSGSHLDRLA